ncbi:hypothetical protein MMC19_005680 [Ptychographa xylographoides]|nr:hypothetical protein [Ptychographa xylographoides]
MVATHNLETPCLIIRSAIPSDAIAIAALRSNPLNNVLEPGIDLTPELYRNRIADWQVAAGKGESAFMVVVLRDSIQPLPKSATAEKLVVSDGRLIGFSGFNALSTDVSIADPSRQVMVGDTGIVIDKAFTRRGYAVEAQSAIFDYGFDTLGCGQMFLETSVANTPMQGLLSVMGLDDVKKAVTTEEGEEGYRYIFGKEQWDEAKRLKPAHV